MYQVMRPEYVKADTQGVEAVFNVRWITVGTAKNMEDAKRKYPLGYWAKCYSWVLEEIRIH